MDNSPNDRVYPQKADFTFYVGIYRDVYLLTVPAAHFALDYHGGPAFKVTPKLSDSLYTACVTLKVWVAGPADIVRFAIGDKVQSAPVVDGYAATLLMLDRVHLWDGVDDPYLYIATAGLPNGETTSTKNIQTQ